MGGQSGFQVKNHRRSPTVRHGWVSSRPWHNEVCNCQTDKKLITPCLEECILGLHVGPCLSGSWSLTPLCTWIPVPAETLCVMRKLCLHSQHSHGGSLGPLCTSRCPFGISVPVASSRPCNSKVLLAFPSASVIRCKEDDDTKVTLYPPLGWTSCSWHVYTEQQYTACSSECPALRKQRTGALVTA